jgi:LDH2 family malate/lactate/ureidoglycolate dehydrogenase
MTARTVRYHADRLIAYATDLLVRVGLAEPMAASIAATLVEGDLLGHDTHGLALLAPYVREIEKGTMTKAGEPVVLDERPASLLWDGRRLPGPWLMDLGFEVLAPKARANGVATLVVRRSHHIACLAVYLQRALAQDFLMLLTCSDPNTASVAPFGGTEPVFTPNPIAAGFPLSRDGVLVDVSASITTNGMTARKYQAGESFAHEWMIDAAGRPTRDPAVLFADPPGTILPIGGMSHGHKGYGLALLVEALTGGLAGHGRADAPEGWGATVHMTLFDLAAFAGADAFKRQMDQITEQCRSNKPIDPVTRVRLPGEAALERRRTQRERGVSLHPAILSSLADVEARYGVSIASTAIG